MKSNLLTDIKAREDKIARLRSVLNKIEFCRLRDLVAKTEIYYDPNPRVCFFINKNFALLLVSGIGCGRRWRMKVWIHFYKMHHHGC